jgi:membrane-bound inhibitor of C-type lysozyme
MRFTHIVLIFIATSVLLACTPRKAETSSIVEYTCKGGEKISAAFYAEGGDRVSLKLNDGRSFTLPNVTAASGIKYATSDEKIVFWAKGDEAFFEEAGKIAATDCTAK